MAGALTTTLAVTALTLALTLTMTVKMASAPMRQSAPARRHSTTLRAARLPPRAVP